MHEYMRLILNYHHSWDRQRRDLIDSRGSSNKRDKDWGMEMKVDSDIYAGLVLKCAHIINNSNRNCKYREENVEMNFPIVV